MADFKWTDEKTYDLIAMFEARPCLYNTSLKEYSNRDVKKKAIEEIVAAFGMTGEVICCAAKMEAQHLRYFFEFISI